MYKKTTKLLAALGLVGGLLAGTGAALASGGDAPELKHQHWSFDGYTGSYDKAALKRGLQVYRDVCSACHSLELVAFRNLSDKGGLEMPIKDMKAIAAEYEFAGIDDEGEEITRAGGAPDYFPGPYANENMASAMNGGAIPPDLSLIAKGRHHGPDYLFSLLTSYELDVPHDVEVGEGLNYNPYFPGGQLAMAQPLYGDDVEYADGTEATIEQEARDVVHFLMWAAEPRLEERKTGGRKAMIFLIILTALTFVCYRLVWSDVEH
jgi:ubiquinol-cytochrome c reductase cytochrome c1 subunit